MRRSRECWYLVETRANGLRLFGHCYKLTAVQYNSGSHELLRFCGDGHSLDAAPAAPLHLVLIELRFLAVAGRRENEQLALRTLGNDSHTDDRIATAELHSAYARCLSSHFAHAFFVETDGLPFGCHEKDAVAFVHELCRDECIPPASRRRASASRGGFVERDRDEPAPPHFPKFVGRCFLHGALSRRHYERKSIRTFLFFRHREHRSDSLRPVERNEIHYRFPFRRALPFRKFIHLQLIHLAAIGKEEKVAMSGGREELRDEILFFRIEIHDAHAAALLPAIFIRIRALDVATLRQDKHVLIVCDKILCREDRRSALHYLCPALVAVLLDHFADLLLDKIHQLFVALQERGELGDQGLHLLQFVLNLFALQASKLLELHVEDGVRLALGELESLYQPRTSIIHVFRLLDELDDLVNMVKRLFESEQNVLAIFCFCEIEFRALRNDLATEGNKVLEERFQGERLRHAVNERNDVVVERFFDLRVFVEIVQHRLRVRIVLQFDDNANVFGALVANVSNSLELLLMHKIRDLLQKVGFIDAKRYRSDDYLIVALLALDDLRIATHDHRPAAGRIRMRDVLLIECDAARRKVGALHELQQIFRRRVSVVDEMHGRLAHLAQIVRRDVRRHTDGDAKGAIQEKIRYRCRHHARLFLGVVVVRAKCDRLFFNISKKLGSETRHLRLRVAIRCWCIAIDRAKIALTDDEGVSHGEILRHFHHRVVDRCVAVRMVLADHVADDSRRLSRLCRGREPALMHRK